MATAAVAVPVLIFLTIYLANAGQGFLLDDFDWVLNSRVRHLADIPNAWGSWSGFFRPVVSVTFTVDEWIFGARPYGYALMNIALALIAAWTVTFLARGFSLSRGASILAGLLWLMNMYFTRTAIMWISGRTAILVALFSALSAGWLVRGRIGPSIMCLVFALFAKEEAVLLPFILLAWLVIARQATGRSPAAIVKWCVAAGTALAMYLILRALTPAMTPATAPDYYKFTFGVSAVWKNIVEYGGRTSILAVVVWLLAMMFLGRPNRAVDRRARAVIWCGAVWLVGALSLACFLPVRSDLYAAVPGIGACLVVAALIDRLWAASTSARRQRALVASIVLSVALAPVYWLRTQRLSRQATFSSNALVDLQTLTRDVPDGTRVLVDDVVQQRGEHTPSMAGAFGAQLNAAYQLQTGRTLNLAFAWEASPEDRAANAAKPEAVLHLAVVDGKLRAR